MLDPTPVLRRWAGRRARRLGRRGAAALQRRQLLSLLSRAAATRFGRDHGFEAIRGVAEFRARVPLRRFEDFWADYWQAPFPRLDNVSWPGTIPYFAETSGTTSGRTKHIPCSREMISAYERGALDLMGFHVLNRPASRVLGGGAFMLGGSTDLALKAPGVRSGDISGILAANVPWWYRRRAFPPRRLALIADWEEKVARLAAASAGRDIRAIGGVPSWLLVFFDALARHRGGAVDPARWFPRLEVLFHGGVDFAPYRRRFETLLGGTGAELREAYAASEGFIAGADGGPGEGLRLLLDRGLFYEFVPLEELDSSAPTRHWLGEAETGVNYALALSSCAGLWGYVLGDTVELVCLDPPRLRVTGRTAYALSAFGEHLIAAEIEAAVAASAAAIGAQVTDYSVGARYPERVGELGGHRYIVEFQATPAPARLAEFALGLDRELCARNDDYAAHRAGGFGMDAPQVRAAPPGTFAAWMRSRGRLGGQHKVPRIVNDRALFDNLRAFVDRGA